MKITAGEHSIPAQGIIEGQGGVRGAMCDTVQITLAGVPGLEVMQALMAGSFMTDDGRALAGYTGLAECRLTLYREPQDARDRAMQQMTAQAEVQAERERQALLQAEKARQEAAQAQEQAEQARQEMGEVMEEVQARLVSPPAQGQPWREDARYIQGDEASEDGAVYLAVRFSRGKRPSASPQHWEVKTEPTQPQRWEDDPSAHPYVVGDLRTYDLDGDASQRKTWRCKKAHNRSTVRRPMAVSDFWEEQSP